MNPWKVAATSTLNWTDGWEKGGQINFLRSTRPPRGSTLKPILTSYVSLLAPHSFWSVCLDFWPLRDSIPSAILVWFMSASRVIKRDHKATTYKMAKTGIFGKTASLFQSIKRQNTEQTRDNVLGEVFLWLQVLDGAEQNFASNLKCGTCVSPKHCLE